MALLAEKSGNFNRYVRAARIVRGHVAGGFVTRTRLAISPAFAPPIPSDTATTMGAPPCSGVQLRVDELERLAINDGGALARTG